MCRWQHVNPRPGLDPTARFSLLVHGSRGFQQFPPFCSSVWPCELHRPMQSQHKSWPLREGMWNCCCSCSVFFAAPALPCLLHHCIAWRWMSRHTLGCSCHCRGFFVQHCKLCKSEFNDKHIFFIPSRAWLKLTSFWVSLHTFQLPKLL